MKNYWIENPNGENMLLVPPLHVEIFGFEKN
jgi:hypothetical protein